MVDRAGVAGQMNAYSNLICVSHLCRALPSFKGIYANTSKDTYVAPGREGSRKGRHMGGHDGPNGLLIFARLVHSV